MKWYEAAFAEHYPLLYRHRDDLEAHRCVANLPRMAPLGEGPVLDLGCGEGRHLVSLVALVERTVGLDLSPALLRKALERRTRARLGYALVRGDMRSLPFTAGMFSAILSLFTAFGYFGGLDDHTGLVGEIARVLRPGGHWFLDYLNCQAVTRELSREKPQVRKRESTPFLIEETRRLGRDPLRVLKSVVLRPLPLHAGEAEALGVPPEGLHYQEQVALFSLAEIDDLAARCGLTRVASAGGYEVEPLVESDSPRWFLVYRCDTGT